MGNAESGSKWTARIGWAALIAAAIIGIWLFRTRAATLANWMLSNKVPIVAFGLAIGGLTALLWRYVAHTSTNETATTNIANPITVRSMVLWSVGILLVGIAVTSTLLGIYATDGPSVQLEAIRTSGTIVVGTGGAAALLLAARRQRSVELTLVHQREVAEESQQDAVSRRITELYTKAVEQLGSESPAVRLGGLYALERLAQENNDHLLRQTVVNVLCAYLRMPDQSTLATSDANESAGPAVNSEQTQVRLTAQRILANHLRRDPLSGPASRLFWSSMDLDLSGARLIDVDFRGFEAGAVSFRGSRFFDKAQFDDARFLLRVNFEDAVFEKSAQFKNAIFEDEAIFRRVEFKSTANFAGTIFNETAQFRGSNFHATAHFSHCKFTHAGVFEESHFAAMSDFNGSRFGGAAVFPKVQFGTTSTFGSASFDGTAQFGGSSFNGTAIFAGSSFNTLVNFGGARFAGHAAFNRCVFNRAHFPRVSFEGEASFGRSQFMVETKFQRASFQLARFDSSDFRCTAEFSRTKFRRSASFSRVRFRSGLELQEAEAWDLLDLSAAILVGKTSFTNLRIKASTGTTFSLPAGYSLQSLGYVARPKGGWTVIAPAGKP